MLIGEEYNMEANNSIAIFENKKIRRIWYNEE